MLQRKDSCLYIALFVEGSRFVFQSQVIPSPFPLAPLPSFLFPALLPTVSALLLSDTVAAISSLNHVFHYDAHGKGPGADATVALRVGQGIKRPTHGGCVWWWN